MASSVFPLLLLTLSALCGTCLTARNSAGQQNNAGQQGVCYDGLGVSMQRINEMEQSLFFDRLFKLTSYRKQFKYKEFCGDYQHVSQPRQGIELSTCAASSYYRHSIQKRGSANTGCCTTVMSMSIPETVTDIMSGVVYQAKHFASSYQLLNLGHCDNAGDTCSLGGTCDQTYRIHWVLVTTPSGDTFVPTSVPSHCTCVYS